MPWLTYSSKFLVCSATCIDQAFYTFHMFTNWQHFLDKNTSKNISSWGRRSLKSHIAMIWFENMGIYCSHY
jgi:hypothetical protein